MREANYIGMYPVVRVVQVKTNAEHTLTHGVPKAGSWGPGHPQRFLKKFYNGRAPTKFWQEK